MVKVILKRVAAFDNDDSHSQKIMRGELFYIKMTNLLATNQRCNIALEKNLKNYCI